MKFSLITSSQQYKIQKAGILVFQALLIYPKALEQSLVHTAQYLLNEVRKEWENRYQQANLQRSKS